MKGKAAPRPSTAPALLLAACSLLILCCAPAQYLGRQHDDLLYMIAAQALSQGGYGLLTTPGTPPLVMLTPGFPLILLPVAWIFREAFLAYQLFLAAILAALPWLVWRWARPLIGPVPALLAALLFGTSPLVLSQAGTVMSEAPYTALELLLLMGLPGLRTPAVGLLLLALTQIRPAGLSLLPAAGARAWRLGKGGDLLWILGPTALGAALWCAWSISVAGEVQELGEFRLSYGGRPLTHPLAVAWDNLKFYAGAWGGSYLPPAAASGPAGPLLGAALLAAAGLGAARLGAPAFLALAGAAAMHAVWAWQYERYLIPLLPLLLAGAAALAGRGAGLVLGALLAAQLSFHSWRWLRPTAWTAPELSQTYAWLRDHCASFDVLASPLYVRDAFYTARPSVPLPDAASPEEFAEKLKARRARRILWQGQLNVGLSLRQTSTLQGLLDRSRRHLQDGRFQAVYENPGESSRVYELRSPR